MLEFVQFFDFSNFDKSTDAGNPAKNPFLKAHTKKINLMKVSVLFTYFFCFQIFHSVTLIVKV